MAGESILVVEDTDLLRRIYTDKLEQEGYHVLQASDGLECLAIVHDEDIDLVLLDLVMPHMSGMEALESIKRDPRTKDIPVVILSNVGQEEVLERGMALGAVDYLVKNTARPADVSAKIRHTLDHREVTEPEPAIFHVSIHRGEADADALAEHRGLGPGLECPACGAVFQLVLTERPYRAGRYDARVACPGCGREA